MGKVSRKEVNYSFLLIFIFFRGIKDGSALEVSSCKKKGYHHEKTHASLTPLHRASCG